MMTVAPRVELTPGAAAPRDRKLSVSPFVSLTASLFFRPGAPRVIALVSCTSREGVSYIGRSFEEFLTQRLGTRTMFLTAPECMARSAGVCYSGVPSGIGLVPSDRFFAARRDTDVLLVDCSSLEASPSIFVLATHVDGILLVVEDGKHSALEIQRAVRLIKDANGIVLGVVLNKRRQFLPKWLYSLFARSK